MSVLIDTNILLRCVQPAIPCMRRRSWPLKGCSPQEPLYIAIQNVAEFWNAATRPQTGNGLGMTVDQAAGEVKRLEDFLEIVSESAASYAVWKALLRAHGVSGAQIHDARLASIMQATGIARILTFNVGDFSRYDGIEAVHPARIA